MATPLALYKFNDASSGTAPTTIADSSGNANPIAITGYATAAWATGIAGSVLKSQTSLAATVVPNAALTALAGSKTASLVVQADYFTNYHSSTGGAGVGICTSDPDDFLDVQWDGGTDTVNVNIRTSAATYFNLTTPLPASTLLGMQQVIAVTLDTNLASTRAKVYLNGFLSSTNDGAAQNTVLGFNSGTKSVYVGNFPGQPSHLDDVGVGHLGIYSATLSAADVLAQACRLFADNDSDPNVTGAHLRAAGTSGGTTDASTASSDHTVAPTQTVAASGNNRGLFLLLTGAGVSAGVTGTPTFNGTNGTLVTSVLSSTNCTEIWWWNDAALPSGAGTYTASATVDGASGTAAATLVYLEGVSQSAPTNFGSATGTSTSLTASLTSSAGASSFLIGALLDATTTDTGVDGANQLRLSAVNGTSTGNTHKHQTAAKFVPNPGANSLSWTGLTTSTAKVGLVVEVREAGHPTITAQPSSTQVASGATASFSVTAATAGGGTLSYQWKVNGTNVSTGSGGTTASYTTAALAYTDDLGSYTCAVTETGGSDPGTTTTSAALVYVGTRVVGANTPVYSASAGTTVAPSYSTLPTIAAGDEIVLVVAQKPSVANGGTVTTPTGYTLIGSLIGAGGYSTTLANNTGNTNLFVYAKTGGAAGSETGTFTVTVGTNGVCGAMLVLLRPVSGSTISYALASGSDSTAGNVSITCGSDPGEVAGDIALQLFNGSSQLILPFSAQAITTTGITYSSVSELVEWGTTVGNDVAGYVASAKTLSGTSSAAPVFTATVAGTNTNARGPGVVLRMRATSAPASAPTLNVQRRAPGFPPRSPLPGLARLGVGILAAAGASQAGNSGTASAAVSPFAVSASGLVTFIGVGSAAVSPFAVDASGSTPAGPIPAPAAQPPPMVYSLGLGPRFAGPPRSMLGLGLLSAAPVATSFTATGSAAISAFAITAAGLVTFISTGSAAASPFAAAATGLETFTGSGSAAVSPFACSGAGLETFSSSGSAAASSFACSASGAEAFTSSGSAACSPFAAAGSGATGTVFTSAGSAALSPFAVTAAGLETFTGTGSAACSSFAASGSGAEAFSCSGSAAMAPFAAAGNGATGTVFSGSAAAAMSPFAVSGSGTEVFTGTGSVAASPFAVSGSGVETFASSGSAACSPFAAAGNGAQGSVFTGSGSAAMAPFAVAGAGAETFSGPAAAALQPFASSSSGALTFTGAALVACSPFGASGVGEFAGPVFGSADVAMASFGVGADGLSLLAITSTGEAALSPFAVSCIGISGALPLAAPEYRTPVVDTRRETYTAKAIDRRIP